MIFYLGTHKPHWLARTTHPLFISRRTLSVYRTPPRAYGKWALDSGGFSELSMFGEWRTLASQYAEEVLRWRESVGGYLSWAAIQDWMCEPFMLAKTGKTLAEHQDLTVRSYFDLRELAPDVPWAPVLQGWHPDDYLCHAESYASAGVDLAAMPAVGVGSVCRRQGTQAGEDVFLALRPLGLELHGFGLKLGFIRRAFAHGLASCDSMAWSYAARKSGKALPGHTHKTCANCFTWAMRWRDDALRLGKRPQQLVML